MQTFSIPNFLSTSVHEIHFPIDYTCEGLTLLIGERERGRNYSLLQVKMLHIAMASRLMNVGFIRNHNYN